MGDLNSKPLTLSKVIKRILGQILEDNGFKSSLNNEWIRTNVGDDRIVFDKAPRSEIVYIDISKNWRQPYPVDKDKCNDYMNKVHVNQGIFKRFNGTAAIQIEYFNNEGKRIRDYCNTETQYYLDSRKVEKSSFTDGIKIVIEKTKREDLFIKYVYGYEKTIYSEIDEFQEVIAKYLGHRKGYYATLKSFTYESQEKLEQIISDLKLLLENVVFEWFDNPLKYSVNEWKMKGISLQNAVVFDEYDECPRQVYPVEAL